MTWNLFGSNVMRTISGTGDNKNTREAEMCLLTNILPMYID